ncbi:hypothetical protein KEM54_001841, partial [Ascosphaera aggregata]
MSIDKKDLSPAPASFAGSIMSSETEPPHRGSTGKFNITLAPIRQHLGNSGEPGMTESPRPESRMRIRRRSSKGSLHSSLHKEELYDICPSLSDHEKDNSIRGIKGVPAIVPRQDAYVTSASPQYALYGFSPASDKDPYEDIFDSLDRRHNIQGNRIRIDTDFLSPYNLSLPDTPQSLFSFQSPTSTNTFYSPLSPRGPIPSPAGELIAWRRASMIPTVPELEHDEIDREQQGEEERVGRYRRRNSIQEPNEEVPSLRQKKSRPDSRTEVTNSGDTNFNMSSLRDVMETSVDSNFHDVGLNSVPYHVELAREVDAAVEKVCNDSANAKFPPKQTSKTAQPRIHPIDTSIGGRAASSSYVDYLKKSPTLNSPRDGWRRGSWGLVPQNPSALHTMRPPDLDGASSMGFAYPQRPATSLGSQPLGPHGYGLLHPASALNNASRYSLGGDPYLPRNPLRRRKSVTSFKDAAPGLVLEAEKYKENKWFAIDHPSMQRPSVEVIVAEKQKEDKGELVSDTDSSETHNTSRCIEARYARPARRADSRGPRIRRMRSRSHFGRLPRAELDNTTKPDVRYDSDDRNGDDERLGRGDWKICQAGRIHNSDIDEEDDYEEDDDDDVYDVYDVFDRMTGE